ncbi:8195_t:CDS:1, partial [Racocetra persica]
NFGIKEIDAEIFANIKSECQVNLPNLVILESRPASNNNKIIFESIDIFLKNLGQDIIDLACNATIFSRTKLYKIKI